MSASRVIRHTGSEWDGVERRRYKDDVGSYLGVVRHTLLGDRDSELDPDLSFEMRYFELEPGGYSSLERHDHPHAVLVVSGSGAVRLGDELERIGPLDVVYVAPRDVHRFEADAAEPLGFICVVDRERDRPQAVDEGGEGP